MFAHKNTLTMYIICILKVYFLLPLSPSSCRYGVIHGAADMEMQPLDKADDEDEDMTVFDMNDRRSRK